MTMLARFAPLGNSDVFSWNNLGVAPTWILNGDSWWSFDHYRGTWVHEAIAPERTDGAPKGLMIPSLSSIGTHFAAELLGPGEKDRVETKQKKGSWCEITTYHPARTGLALLQIARREVFLEQKGGVPVREEWYDVAGNLVATTTFSQVEEVREGYSVPMEAITEIPENTVTIATGQGTEEVQATSRQIVRSFQWLPPGLRVPREIRLYWGERMVMWARFHAYRVNQGLPEKMFEPVRFEGQAETAE